MLMHLRSLLTGFVLSAVLGAPLAAHGGTYRGPGTGLGPGAAGPQPGPATGGGAGSQTRARTTVGTPGDLTGWQLWWGFNREPYLALRSVLAQGGGIHLSTGDPRAAPSPRPTDDQVSQRMAPGVLAALRGERNPDISTAALLALAKFGPRLSPEQTAEASRAMRERLSDANQEVAESAALALGILGHVGDLALIGDLLADTEAGRKACGKLEVTYRTRAFAAYALGLIGARTANVDRRRWIVHQLVRALEAPDGSTRDVPVAALIALGLVPLAPGAMQPSDDGPLPPSASIEGQFDFVAAWFADPRREAQSRAYAPVTLARLAVAAGDDRRATCVQLLSRALEIATTEPAVVRQSCALALGIVADGDDDAHDAHARAMLKLASSTGDRLSRRFAWISLAEVGARPGRDGKNALSETRPYLAGLLARGSTPERPWLSLALAVGERAAIDNGLTSSRGVHEALEVAVKEHTSPAEAGAHMLSLALSGAPSATTVLMARLEELRDDDARAHGCVALGLARAGVAIEPLRKIVLGARYQPQLLREAAIGLGLLGDRSLTPVLVDMLRDARGLSALSSIATALGWIGDERAVDPLLAIATDTGRDAAARAFAIVALGLMGDPAPLPWNTPISLDVNWWLPPATLFDPTTSTGVLDIL